MTKIVKQHKVNEQISKYDRLIWNDMSTYVFIETLVYGKNICCLANKLRVIECFGVHEPCVSFLKLNVDGCTSRENILLGELPFKKSSIVERRDISTFFFRDAIRVKPARYWKFDLYMLVVICLLGMTALTAFLWFSQKYENIYKIDLVKEKCGKLSTQKKISRQTD